MRPAYRDLIQNALYGRLNETLKLLCEDKIAEGILEGVFDYLLPQERIKWEAVHIGRDTGANEFPQHAQALRKFDQIQDTIFILDGDQRGSEIESRIQETAGGRCQHLNTVPSGQRVAGKLDMGMFKKYSFWHSG